MSASRDKTQKFTFIYTNLYQLYKKEGDSPKKESDPKEHVIKAEDAHSQKNFYDIKPFRPVEIKTQKEASSPAVESLKENLKKLDELHSRLKFMLEELEELTKE